MHGVQSLQSRYVNVQGNTSRDAVAEMCAAGNGLGLGGRHERRVRERRYIGFPDSSLQR